MGQAEEMDIQTKDKTTKQFTIELFELSQRVAELEATVENCEQAKAEREHLLEAEREQRLLAETLRPEVAL